MSGRIIVVSNRLPLSIVERDGQLAADRSIGGLATALSSVFSRYDPLWVGWTGVRRVLSKDELASLDLPGAIVPVQASQELIEHYYDHISNQVLWPGLHGLEPTITASDEDWASFLEVTAIFAATVQELIRPDDIIWIHDSHLIMLPQALRDAGVANRIGYFAHSPFPPSPHFLKLPRAHSMLRSLCQVEVLGLQTARDVDAFWETLSAGHLKEQPGLVRAFPIGVDYDLYRQAPKRADVQTCLKRLHKETKNKRVILSISRLDYTKGILGQLQAVERFLESQERPQDFVYMLAVAPSRENVPEYQELKLAIDSEVARINKRLGRRGWQPVDYHYRNIDFPEVVARYLLADVLLLTPPLDGMNLIAKEYIAARQANGALVLGNAVGAAFQLETAVLVNATDTQDIANGLEHAFTMPQPEREQRWRQLTAAVRQEDVFWWAEQFMHELERSG